VSLWPVSSSGLQAPLPFDGYSIWLWAYGIKHMGYATCQTWVFFFSRQSLSGWICPAFLAVFILKIIVDLICLCIIFKKFSAAKIAISPLDFCFSSAPGTPEDRKVWRRQALPVASLISMFIVILSVELTISWNKLADVNSLSSSSQIIPAAIGIGSLVKVCFSWAQEQYNVGDKSGIWKPANPNLLYARPSTANARNANLSKSCCIDEEANQRGCSYA